MVEVSRFSWTPCWFKLEGRNCESLEAVIRRLLEMHLEAVMVRIQMSSLSEFADVLGGSDRVNLEAIME
jgi:hypothetical protein